MTASDPTERPAGHDTRKATTKTTPPEPSGHWRYQPDETPKRKHAWANDHAGFEELPSGELVGKCPRSMTDASAEALLNDGVPWTPVGWTKRYPKRIYNVHDGVVYRAVSTNPGVSYHGFPEQPEDFPPNRDLKEQLLEKAKREGAQSELKVTRWMRSTL